MDKRNQSFYFVSVFRADLMTIIQIAMKIFQAIFPFNYKEPGG